MAFTFAAMTEADLVLLHRSLEQPHVRAFYDQEPRTLEGVAAQVRGKILGTEPTRPFIAAFEGTAIGYLQAYRLADHPDHARAIDADGEAAGVDMLIGEPAYVHRGLGAVVLRQFVDELVWDITGATTCWIGPAVRARGTGQRGARSCQPRLQLADPGRCIAFAPCRRSRS